MARNKELKKATIVFKGGLVKVECKDLTITYNTENQITKLRWENMKPAPLFLKLEDISAIFDGWVE